MFSNLVRENRYLLKYVLSFLGVALLNKFTHGFGLVAVVLAGVYFSTRQQMGKLFVCYLMIPFVTNMCYAVAGGCNSVVTRLGTAVLTGVLLLQASNRNGPHSLPLGVLYLYLFVAMLSSIGGWCPLVSYFKIINFLVFLIAVHIGTRNLHKRPDQLVVVRNAMLAFAIIMIFGSMASMAFPSIGYSMELHTANQWGMNDYDALRYVTARSSSALFSGLTNHSQDLGPVTAMFAGWVLADMLMCERRVSSLHVLLLACAPVLIYKSGSRVALLGAVSAMGLIGLVALQDRDVPQKVKMKVKMLFNLLLLLCVVGGAAFEFTHHGVSNFIRKNRGSDSGQVDQRTLGEAFTASRSQSIEMNMADFRRNPVLGTGFQTEPFHQELLRSGWKAVFSAPIEKGVLPLMVLGETGAIGAAVFLLFVCHFFFVCSSRGYTVTIVLFATLLMENMGEACFFSPAAVGGVLWSIAVFGGFTLDMKKIADKKFFIGIDQMRRM